MCKAVWWPYVVVLVLSQGTKKVPSSLWTARMSSQTVTIICLGTLILLFVTYMMIDERQNNISDQANTFYNRSIKKTDGIIELSSIHEYPTKTSEGFWQRQPIDAVYTWVNGSDPGFLQSLEKYSKAAGWINKLCTRGPKCTEFSISGQYPLV